MCFNLTTDFDLKLFCAAKLRGNPTSEKNGRIWYANGPDRPSGKHNHYSFIRSKKAIPNGFLFENRLKIDSN